jgi:hypothetical protein
MFHFHQPFLWWFYFRKKNLYVLLMPREFWGIAIILEFDRNSKGWITCSFGVRGSAEGWWVKSKDGMGLDSTNEDSSTLDMTLPWRGLVIMTKEVCLFMKFSRNFTCFVIGLCVNLPSAVTSRHRSASMSISKQKRCDITPSGKDQSGLEWINSENLAQAAPKDSFSYCSW